MLYVAKLHAYAVLHVCECKDKARQSKNKRFQFLWQYVAGVCRLQCQKQQEKLARLHSVHLLCTRQSVNGAYRDHYTNKLNKLSYGKNKRNENVS